MTARSWVDDLERHLTGQTATSWDTPGQMAVDLDPRTVQTPALDLIDDAITRTIHKPDGRLIIVMPPQEGKSQRITRRTPAWVLHEQPETRIAIASYEHGVARRWGRAIRDDIRNHPELGLTVRRDLGSQSEWQLAGHDGGVVTVGIGGGLTGRPVDLLIIDDPIKDRRQADSKTYRQIVWDWWLEVGATRLAPGAPVILVLTRWHEDDLAGRLLAAEDGDQWEVLRIPAEADHDPEQGETDPLGREPGEFLRSARGRTVRQWEKIRTRSGSRTWSALYQGRPSAQEGVMFKRHHWRFYDQPLWLERDDGARIFTTYDDLLISWDMTFKGTEGTDRVAGGVWLRRGADVFLVDVIVDRMDFVRTLQEFGFLAARWPQAVAKLVEDKANGPAVISMLQHQIPGIIPEEPHGGKEARAAAASPLVEAGNVWLPHPTLAPWVKDYVDELAAFPTGINDDLVDMTSQALNRLLVQPLIAGVIFTAADFDDEIAGFGSYVP